MRTVEVSVGVNRFRAQWNPEMAQDIATYHNIDAEAELTRILSEEIGREINRRVIEDVELSVQRVFGRTVAQDLVPVQPLSAPTDILYFLDYKNNILEIFKLLRG